MTGSSFFSSSTRSTTSAGASAMRPSRWRWRMLVSASRQRPRAAPAQRPASRSSWDRRSSSSPSATLPGGVLASFDAITLYLDLSPEETSAYTSLSGVFTGAYGEFRRAAPDASWPDFSQHAARTPEGRRALAAWRQMQRLLAFTHAKRPANTTAASRNVSLGSSDASRRSGMWFASRSRSPLTAG